LGQRPFPGIAAKPLIDMIAGGCNFQEARAAFQPLRDHSYVHTPHRPGTAHHFSKPSPRLPEAQYGLHLTEPGSDLWRERLAFRDALRSDPALATEYQDLKLRLAEQDPLDLRAYTAGKRDFGDAGPARSRHRTRPPLALLFG
jgi:GrpB-like predicted nucleotidyltransferase (UPF0157 family)